jgi:hypothetical protein
MYVLQYFLCFSCGSFAPDHFMNHMVQLMSAALRQFLSYSCLWSRSISTCTLHQAYHVGRLAPVAFMLAAL